MNGGQQHNRGSSRRPGQSWALLLLCLLVVCAPRLAASRRSPASCYITDAQLGPPPDADSCNSTCRSQTLEALEGIYDGLGGPRWNFNFETSEDDEDTERNQGSWMQCEAGGCRPSSVEKQGVNNRPMPSYCCWQGVLCCHEHSAFTATRQQACAYNSVYGLQLRAGNLRGKLDSTVMGHLQTLHQHGLTVLDLSRNQLTGDFPASMGQLTNLHALLLGANNLTGSIPATLGKLKQLYQLDLEFNFLRGQVSSAVVCPPGNRLNALMLRANNFTGGLDLSACGNLTVVDVQDNAFAGSIPVGSSNTFLHVFRARNNYFTGTVPDELWELPQLITVDISNNSLTGTLAETIGTTSFLTNLYLSSNKLRGTIPRNMTTSSQMTNVVLSDNPWLVGSIPSFRWMLGLQVLDLSNTRIKGTIPAELGALPFLMSVDLRNTLMTCCHSEKEAERMLDLYNLRNKTRDVVRDDGPDLLPSFLEFNLVNKRSPVDEPMPSDPFLTKLMATGQNLMCPTVMRAPNTNPGSTTVYRPANLTGQEWRLDPEYFWFQKCDCLAGYDEVSRDDTQLSELWCEDRNKWYDVLGVDLADQTRSCGNMSLQVCKKQAPRTLSTWHYVLISFAALAVLILLIMLASLFLSLCIARTGKVRRQLEWWRKHLSGMPQHGKMSIVVTDIEGYSDLFKRCPEPMYEALTLHNNVIRRAKYANCGSTVQQEGDSYTLVFHEPLDAVAFCLQAQLALMEVPWPGGLYDDSSQHSQRTQQYDKLGHRTRSRARSKFGQDSSRKASGVASFLPSATSSWLRRPRANLKHTTSTGSIGLGGGPPSPTASENLASMDAGAGTASSAVVPAAGYSMASRGSQHMSRARMLELFARVTSSGGGNGEAGLFNGLRVRMGVVTGVVEGNPEPSAPSANIMNSALYKLALDVSDAGSGGQVLVDEATFNKVKEDLRPLGAVGPSGINYHKLAERVSLFHLLCLGTLFARGSRFRDVEEAVVLDMGQYELQGTLAGEKRGAQAASGGQPTLAGMFKRASMKFTGWAHTPDASLNHSIHTLPECDPVPPPGAAGAAAAATSPGHTDPDSSSTAAAAASCRNCSPQQHHHGALAAFTTAISPRHRRGRGDDAGSNRQEQEQQQQRASGWGSSPEPGDGAVPIGIATAGRRGSLAVGGAGGIGSSGAGGAAQKRVRMMQVLSPSLVGRAHVWGNKLSVRSTWVCIDAPYFEAPGALEAPLGATQPNRAFSVGRGIGGGGAAAECGPQQSSVSITPASSSFVSVSACSQQSASQHQLQPPSTPQQQYQQYPQQQQQVLVIDPQQLEQGPGMAALTSQESSIGLPGSGGSGAAAAGAGGGVGGGACALVVGSALVGAGGSTSSSRAFQAWPSIEEEACSTHHHPLSTDANNNQQQQQPQQVVVADQQGTQQLLLPQQQKQQPQQQLQSQLSVSAFAPTNSTLTRPTSPPPQQPAPSTAATEAAAAAAAAAVARQQLLRAPIPPVTMVFMLVEGAKVFGQRRKQLVKDVHAQLSDLLMLALKHVPGGYMCRMQEGDLKYMVAFSSARAALEWCLMVQEAAMYLPWPHGLCKVPQLRAEYDSDNQLVFRGPRIKMGVCEGVPQSIIPNHEGRADYHGASINQAARFMDAAAHGGQIACELELALAVMQQWRNDGGGGSTAAAAAAAGTLSLGVQQQQQQQASGEDCHSAGDGLRVLSAPELDHGDAAAAAAGVGGEQGRAAAMRGKSAGGAVGGVGAVSRPTLMSLNSSVGHRQHDLQQPQQQQQQQQQQQPPAGLSAAASIAADDDSSMLPPVTAALPPAAGNGCADGAFAAAATVAAAAAGGGVSGDSTSNGLDAAEAPAGAAGDAPAGAAAAGPTSTTSPSPLNFRAASRGNSSNLFAADSSTEAIGTGGSSSISNTNNNNAAASRFSWLFKNTAAGGGQQNSSAHGGQTALGVPANNQLTPPPAAALLDLHQAPRLFELPQDQVDRAPVVVEVHHLGKFKFKGNPQPLPMVNVTLAALAGRLPLLPQDPPKGKGGRVEAKEGLVARCEADLPVLVQDYRARVPLHILEHVELIPALHSSGPSSPRRQVAAALRSSSMPNARSASQSSMRATSLALQRPRPADLQLAAMEGGYGGFGGPSSSQSSPTQSPQPLGSAGRSSSFTARLFGKQSKQDSMSNGFGLHWMPGGVAESAFAASGGGGAGAGGSYAAGIGGVTSSSTSTSSNKKGVSGSGGDVVLEMRPGSALA